MAQNTFYIPIRGGYKPPKKALRFDAEIDGVRGEFFAYSTTRKIKGKRVKVTEVYNKRGLRLMRTKKYSPEQVRADFSKRKSYKFQRGSEKLDTSKPSLPFRAYDAQLLSLKTKTILLTSSRISKTRAGKIELSVTFYGSSGERFTSEGGSARLRRLDIPQERDKAFNEAFRGAMSDLPFSYTSYKINWIHYSYYIRHVIVRRPKFRQMDMSKYGQG